MCHLRACNQFCKKGANPFDLILERQEQTGVLNIPEQNTQLFRNLPNAPTQVTPGEPGRPALSLCSVGDLVPGLFEGSIFEGLTFPKYGDFFCGVGWVSWQTVSLSISNGFKGEVHYPLLDSCSAARETNIVDLNKWRENQP